MGPKTPRLRNRDFSLVSVTKATGKLAAGSAILALTMGSFVQNVAASPFVPQAFGDPQRDVIRDPFSGMLSGLAQAAISAQASANVSPYGGFALPVLGGGGGGGGGLPT